MNEIMDITEATVAAPAVVFNPVTGQFEDSEGNPVEITTEEIGHVTTEGDTATDVTVN
jgi:hypothetical protein